MAISISKNISMIKEQSYDKEELLEKLEHYIMNHKITITGFGLDYIDDKKRIISIHIHEDEEKD